MKLKGHACEHPTVAGKPCVICATHYVRSWYCEPCNVEVYSERCKYCGKSAEEDT